MAFDDVSVRRLKVSSKVAHFNEPHRFLLSELKRFVDAAMENDKEGNLYVDLNKGSDRHTPFLTVEIETTNSRVNG